MRSTGTCTDQKEVNFHGSLAASWWDDEGIIGPLQALNRLRVPFVRDGLINCNVLNKTAVHDRHCLRNISILDVGCGGGILCEALAKLGANVVGLDPSRDLVNIAKNHSEKNSSIASNIRYVNDVIENFAPNNQEQFDVVISSEVIEHVTNKELFLAHCISTLKPNGSLFITTPNQTPLSWFVLIVVAETAGFMPKGLHEYSKFIPHQKLEKIIESNDCRIKSVQGFAFNPITKSCEWVSHKLLLYAVHAVKMGR